jgi:hypothetical protein
MKKVFCPVSGKSEWANVSGKDPVKNDPRCTKCG